MQDVPEQAPMDSIRDNAFANGYSGSDIAECYASMIVDIPPEMAGSHNDFDWPEEDRGVTMPLGDPFLLAGCDLQGQNVRRARP